MNTQRFRLTHEQRAEQIAAAALMAAEKYGLAELQRRQVAEVAGCSEALVSYYYQSKEDLQHAAITVAKRVPCYKVLAQAVTTPGSWPVIPDELRRRALEWVAYNEE